MDKNRMWNQMKEGQNRRSFLKRIPRRRFVFFLMLFLIVMTTITLTFMNDSYSQDTVGTVWDGVSESIAFSQGNGSSSNPYLINDPSDFAYLVHLLNDSEATNYNNKYYALATDLDFGGHSLSSISTTLAFQGTIDGQGHTIRNLEVEQTGETAVGLFGNLENATIQNLNLEGIQIEAVSTNTPLSYGVLAGTITHSHIHNVSIPHGV